MRSFQGKIAPLINKTLRKVTKLCVLNDQSGQSISCGIPLTADVCSLFVITKRNITFFFLFFEVAVSFYLLL